MSDTMYWRRDESLRAIDCSGGMDGGKIEALNSAFHDTIPHMRGQAAQCPEATILVQVLKFSNGAQWVVYQPTPVEQFEWTDLMAEGVTDLGKALSMVA